MCRILPVQPDPVRIRTAASGIPTTLKLDSSTVARGTARQLHENRAHRTADVRRYWQY